jgi:hypothetical protein
MPVSYRIDQAQRLVYSRGWGAVNEAELTSHAQSLRIDPAFNPDFGQIVDFTEVTRLGASYRSIRALARLVPFSRSARRVAVIQRDLYYGIIRMYELLLETAEGRITAVRTLDAAYELFGVPPGQRPASTAAPDRVFDGGSAAP